jgi:1-acyl-sn-glycerol-3-phosphate acyltransferase
MERSSGPLKKAHDAVVVDTSDMTIDAVTDTIVGIFRKQQRENNHWIYTFFKPIFMVIFKALFGIKIYGAENIPKEAGILLASNHASVIDPIILGLGARRQLSFMAKQDLFKVRILGWLISKINVYPINRETADTHALVGGLKMVNERKAVVIFPEGTRTSDGTVKAARKYGVGFIALTTGCPVVPAYIKGSFTACPKGARLPRRCKISVTFSKPLTFEDIPAEGKERYRLAAGKVMDAIKTMERQARDEG